jgi:hypothetical protein
MITNEVLALIYVIGFLAFLVYSGWERRRSGRRQDRLLAKVYVSVFKLGFYEGSRWMETKGKDLVHNTEQFDEHIEAAAADHAERMKEKLPELEGK